nr:ComEC/Rec2 family competence protein [Fulvivirga sedimenti]
MLAGKDELATVQGILLGDRRILSDQLRTAYQRVGGMHVLAVSGMHVSILFLFIQLILHKVPNYSVGKWVKILVPVILLWLYAAVVGYSPSVLRAVLFLTIFSVGKLMLRPVSIVHTLSVTAFIVWLTDPFQVYTVGFQLSYGAVCGIALFQPIFEKMLINVSSILAFILRIFTVSISAQALTWPLIIFYFGGISPGGILFSMVLIPAVFVVIFLSVLGLISFGVPYFSRGVSSILSYVVSELNEAVVLLSDQEGMYQYMDFQNITLMLAVGIIISTGILFYFPGRRLLAGILFLIVVLTVLPRNLAETNKITISRGIRMPVIRMDSPVLSVVVSDQSVPLNRELSSVKRIQYGNYTQQLYKFGNTRVFSTSERLTVPISADIIIINGGPIPGNHVIESGQVIVLAPGLSFSERKMWREWGLETGCKIHDLRTMGTFLKITAS